MKTRFNSKCLMIMALLVLLAVGALFTPVIRLASAQATGQITVEKPDVSAYPLVTTTFRAIDPSGSFIKNLQLGEVRIIENDLTVSKYTLKMTREGVRFFVAINEGPTLANYYAGVRRIDRIKTALFNWIASQASDSTDEFNLVTNAGPLSMDASDPAKWKSALESYDPNLLSSTPGMASFSTAVDSALNSDSASEKRSAILFITSLPTAEQFAGMQEILARTKDSNIRVFIWLIGPEEYAGSDAALQLQTLAESTGGQYFLFSGAEQLPELAPLLDPLEYLYHLSYTTSANVSGKYSLVIHIKRGDVSLDSAPVTYTLSISPPNPIFLSPPAEITRGWTETKRKTDAVLTPYSTSLEIMVEFPDDKTHELVYSRLFVDGKLVDEHTTAPFTAFKWDLTPYVASGSHNLQVIIADTLGLKGQTIEIPVQVTVEPQNLTLWDLILARVNLVNGIIGGIILLIVVAGLVSLFRLVRRKFRRQMRKRTFDPVTQPVQIEGSYVLATEKPGEKIKWPVIRGLGMSPARLLQKRSASPDGVEYLAEIPLGNEEIFIGSERRKVDYVLVHPSISPRHSRIFKDADGNYRIADAGSAAGTWLNYAPVSTRGARLEHGDLVQFGRLAYIFEVHGAAPGRVQVLPYTED